MHEGREDTALEEGVEDLAARQVRRPEAEGAGGHDGVAAGRQESEVLLRQGHLWRRRGKGREN